MSAVMWRWASPMHGLVADGEGESSFNYHSIHWGDGESCGYYWGNQLGDGYLSLSDWGGDPEWDADPTHRWLGGGEA